MEDTQEWSTAKLAGIIGAFIGGIWIAARKFVKAQEAIPADRSEALERRVKELETTVENAITLFDGQIKGLRQQFTLEAQRLDHKIDRKEALSREAIEELTEQFTSALRAMEGAKKMLSDALGK